MVRILKARKHRSRPSRPARVPRLESLEARNLLATLTVTNTNDSGAGSLAQAILDANSQAIVGGVPNTIAFDIPGPGLHKITLQNPLPTLTNPVIVNGYTQPGASPNTNPIDQPDNAVLQVQIDGSQVPFAQGLAVGKGAAGSTIEGLVIDGFNSSGTGISLSATDGGNHVAGNFIGVDPTGLIASTLNSNSYGIQFMGPNNVIGGTNPADRNVISGNHFDGLVVTGASATNNLIEGNYVGLKADGNSAFTIGFSQESILIDHASGTTVGGTTTAARNVIAGANAIDLNSATNTTIEGNYIGIDRTGTMPVLSLKALTMTGSSGTKIGGSTPGAGNVMGGNAGAASQVGMTIDLSSSTTIQGNFMGTDPSGTHNIGPFSLGITVQRSTGTTIGGTNPGEGNVIANDIFGGSGASIFFPGTPTTVNDVLIEGNSFFGNDGAAILASNVAPPFLTGATSTTVTGHITGVPGSTYRVEYFATPDTGGASKAQGKTLIGFQDGLVADSSGNVPLSFSPGGGVPSGEFITATATKDEAATSGFSQGVEVSIPATSADLGVAASASPNPVAAGANATFTITVTNAGPDAATQAALATAVPAGTQFVSMAAPAGWTVNTPAVGGTGAIGASIPSLAAGDHAVFTLVVRVDPKAAAGATVALSSTVSSTTADTNPGNQSASASTIVASAAPTSADVGVAVSAAPNSVAAGGEATFTITLTNAGPDAASHTALATVVPAGTEFVSMTAPAGWTVNAPAIGGTGAIGASIASLAAGNHAVFTLVVRVDPNAAGGATVALSSRVSTNAADTNPGNQSASASTTVAYAAPTPTPTPTPTPAPTVVVGPQVSTLQRFGVHEHPTVLVVGFNGPLDAASAQDLRNYRITGPNGRSVGIDSAVYDAATRAVTIHPSQRLNVHWNYQFFVNGTTATGVRGTNGALIDGAHTGKPDGDYNAVINWSTLVQTPAAPHAARHPHGPLVVHRVAHVARSGRR
jgi:uncharacterized repeat protein (TIGR01451 family)